ncbi:hypothetical protein, partial [Bacteroides pyogenes]
LNVFYSLVVDSERKVGPTHAKRYGMRRVKRRRGFFGGVPGGNGAFYEMRFGTLCCSQAETALLDDKASVDIKQSLCHFRTEPLLPSNRASVAIEQNLRCYQTGLCPRHSDIAANSTECQPGVHGTIFRNIRNSASPTD